MGSEVERKSGTLLERAAPAPPTGTNTDVQHDPRSCLDTVPRLSRLAVAARPLPPRTGLSEGSDPPRGAARVWAWRARQATHTGGPRGALSGC